ncbi:MFS transporter [Sulfuracidifex metallicus]|uniref:MFS transporter n=1 Tax=Sulfuracidifex metallicus TaxID=47303 RepID=UPI0022767D81|nr:MFS transporter [Sulfuracidifex metallicus]MCY0850061.1 MFS transporter [Sulfuracidifex metallicus]
MDFDNFSEKFRSFFLSSGGFFLDGYDLSVISYALFFIKGEMSLNAAQEGLVSASSLMGMAIGAIIFGALSDKLGRKKLMGIDLFFFSIFALLSATSNNFLELFVSRFLLGIGIGGDYPISSTVVSEFSPTRSRGRYLMGSVSMYWIGTLFSAFMNLVFLPTGEQFWRYSFAMGGLLAIPIVVGRIKLSESPRWLASKGLMKGEGIPTPEEENKGVTWRDLLKGKVGMTLMSLSAIWFLFDVASYGIGLYYPSLLHQFAFPSEYETLYGTMLISVGAILGYAIAEVAVDSAGRRFTLMAGLGAMAFFLLLGGLISIRGAGLVPYFMVFVAMEQWAGAVTLFYPAEIFPTSVRSTAQGVTTAFSRVGAVLGVFFFPSMVKYLGLSESLMLFGLTSAIALTVSAVAVKETKMRKLEDISVSKT